MVKFVYSMPIEIARDLWTKLHATRNNNPLDKDEESLYRALTARFADEAQMGSFSENNQTT